jgi:hypothetical protein
MVQREYPNITIEDYHIINQNSQSARYEYLDGELRMLAEGSADLDHRSKLNGHPLRTIKGRTLQSIQP